ncbi:MAG: hypothetical protein PHE48_02830 [Candidatus Daviesbacteria bacterium]|nr:hypothetical protein [Candidatus Daviesbacteria bacterium]
MFKSGLSKASAVLIGLSVLVTSAGIAFADNLVGTTSARKPVEPNKIQLTQRINAVNIENRTAAMREKLASREAALKLKLQTFRDQKKATVAARISANLNQINQNQTTQMQKHLDTMTSILDKLEARVNKPTPDIKDPANAKAAIASARTAIASASALVAAQAQNDYTIQVTSENRIGIDAKIQRDKLHTDLLTLRKSVINAKQSVANAIRVAKSGKEATTSGKQ